MFFYINNQTHEDINILNIISGVEAQERGLIPDTCYCSQEDSQIEILFSL